MLVTVLLLLNVDTTCRDKTHEVFVARQHGDNLIRRDTTSRFHGANVYTCLSLEADDKREMLKRGKTL